MSFGGGLGAEKLSKMCPTGGGLEQPGESLFTKSKGQTIRMH